MASPFPTPRPREPAPTTTAVLPAKRSERRGTAVELGSIDLVTLTPISLPFTVRSVEEVGSEMEA